MCSLGHFVLLSCKEKFTHVDLNLTKKLSSADAYIGIRCSLEALVFV